MKIATMTFTLGLLASVSAAAQQTEWRDVPLSDNTWFEANAEYRSAQYTIEVPALSALEYKIGMEEGAVVAYRWTTDMAEPDLLNVEFHGHTEPAPGEPGDVMFYTVHQNGEESGALKAPFTGVHGWYLENNSEEDIEIELEVAGFYSELD